MPQAFGVSELRAIS